MENGALTKIFKPKEEVTGGWIILHSEFHDLCISSSIIRVINSKGVRWIEHVEHALQKMKPEKLKPLGRPRHGWEDEIKVHHNRIEWNGMAVIYPAQHEDNGRLL